MYWAVKRRINFTFFCILLQNSTKNDSEVYYNPIIKGGVYMFTSVFLDLVYLFFPISIYFLYLVYSKATYEKEKTIFLDLALFTSYYLCSKFATETSVSVLLIGVALIIAIHKKRIISSTLLIFGISFFFSKVYDVNVSISLFSYALIFALGFLTRFKISDIYVLVRILFDLIIMIFTPNEYFTFDNFIFFLISWMLMYVVYYFIIWLYTKVETVVKMYRSFDEIMKEKTLYESLFKITHEIKNPLAVCKGYLDMFDIKNASRANKYIGIINQEIDRTLVLLQDFSNASKLKIEKNETDITMLMEDVCDESRMVLKGNIKFEYYLDDKEIYINGDYNRLKQVFINVIKNAKEAIKERGIVKLEARKVKENYVVTIKDNGGGMDKETIDKIGTPFYTTKKCGTGLGVCFSKEIIEKHGGVMEYKSRKNHGTTVKITLPILKHK